MYRTLPFLGAGWALGGCLWIGPGHHEDRKALLAIELAIDGVSPDAWSACVDEPPRFLVEGTVAALHAGEPFEAWFQVQGDERRSLGTINAGAAGDDGRAPISTTLDLEETLALLPACADSCALAITVGVGRVGLEDQADTTITVLAEQEPALAGVDLVDAAQDYHDVASTPLGQNPADSWSVVDYPFLVFELDDPHLALGLGGQIDARYCPEGVDPVADEDACLVLAAESSTDVLFHDGDMAFRVDTSGLGSTSCAVPGSRYVLWGVVRDHVCASPVVLPLTDPFRFVIADCDGDGVQVPDDCDDDDASRTPGRPEVWYDGIDADCAGDDDFDQDGDGVDGPSLGGVDCDDTNPSVNPGAPEVCDGADNDCQAGEPEGQVTLFGGAGAVNYGPPTNVDPVSDALQDMLAGDELVLCAGDYMGNFTLAVEGTVRSASGDPATTALVAAAAGEPVLTIGDGGPPIDAVVRGLGIRGGSGVPEGGGLEALGAATLLVEDCDISGNDADRGGGLAVGGIVTIHRTTVTGNMATDEGGGIAAAAGTELEIEEDVVISGNVAARGGGLHLVDAVVDLDDTVSIELNTASAEGGGVWAGGDLTFEDGTLASNVAANGGGVHLDGDGTWELTDVTVSDHVGVSLTNGAGIQAGGAGILTLTRVDLLRNVAGGHGGGLYAASFGPGQVDVTLVNCTINENEAAFEGGGVAIHNGYLTTRSGVLRNNAAAYGAGIHARGVEVRLGSGFLGTDLLSNDASIQGGGLRLVGGAGIAPLLDVEGSSIDANTADYGGGVYLDADDPAVVNTFDDGTLDDNVANVEGGAMYVDDASVELQGALHLGGNTPDGVRLVDEVVEACAGVTVDDPVTNGSFNQGALLSCFEVTASSVSGTCGC